MTDVAESTLRARSSSTIDVPDRTMFWKWVWSAVRPLVGWALALAGTIALVVGWFGVSGESLTAKQLPYLVSAGLAGIALFIMAAVFLATDDVRRQFTRISELERKVDDLYSLFVADINASASAPAPPAPSSPAPSAADLVALPSGTSYHRPGCRLVAGKADTAAVTPAQIARRGLRPCRVCDPGSAG
jgi:hypothetical protein